MINKYNIPEYGVSEINNAIKDVLQNNFDYVLVRGEISEIKTSSNGHIYLTLKDNNSILSCSSISSQFKSSFVKTVFSKNND